jgi:penicillin-binding protein-related factor A (putative recombinase)
MSDRGKSFEKRVAQELRLQGVTIIKVPESQRYIGGKVIRKKTQFDFCAGVDGLAIFFDAKSYEKESVFNFKSRVLNEKCIHQFHELNAAVSDGNIAGYLIHFPKEGVIGWASIQAVNGMIQGGVKSIKPDCLGVEWQLDAHPIDLRSLCIKEIANIRGKIKNGSIYT